MMKWVAFAGFAAAAVAVEFAYQRHAPNAHAQDGTRNSGGPMGPDSAPPRGRDFGGGRPGAGPGFGGPGGPELELVSRFDKDANGWLNSEERQEARTFLKSQPGGGRRGGFGPGPGGPGGRGGMPQPGEIFAPALMEGLDRDRDDQLSLPEAHEGIGILWNSAGRKQQVLATQDLAEALNAVIPAPGMGGGPGGRGPGRNESARDPRQEGGRPGNERPREGRGFGPGHAIAEALVRKAGKSPDDGLSKAELEKVVDGLFTESDKDHDSRLAAAELSKGISDLFASAGPMGGPGGGGPGGGPGGPGGRGRRVAGTPGPKVDPASVRVYGDESLYDLSTLRTLFLTFDNTDWEKELEEFHGTDVEVPATLLVDGKAYSNVGIHFRGMSSYGGVPTGSKRSLNVAIDLADSKQRLLGYKTLNLLNAHEDGSFLSSVLYSQIARKHIPAPKANFVKVVINGESWGVYVNVQQFNKDLLAENYPSSKGARWKVSGSPAGGGGLEYLGENIEDYKRRYEIKTEDNEKSWKAFIRLCRVLNETPTDELEAAIEPILDLEQTLWFLALDVSLCNNDGYWVRASDYSIYLDPEGRFHPIPHDMNEAFRPGGGPGMGGPGPGGPGGPGMGRGPGGGRGEPRNDGGPGAGRGFDPGDSRGEPMAGPPPGGPGMGPRGGRGGFGPGGGGVELDPLIALDDPRKPLRSRLLAVPALRARYLAMVKTIAEQDLAWDAVRPVVEQARGLLSDEIRMDTRKLSSFEEFETALSSEEPRPAAARSREMSVRTFVEQRRAYLLKNPAVAEK